MERSNRHKQSIPREKLPVYELQKNLWDNEQVRSVVILDKNTSIASTSRGLVKCKITKEGVNIERADVDIETVENVSLHIEEKRDPMFFAVGAGLSFILGVVSTLYSIKQDSERSRKVGVGSLAISILLFIGSLLSIQRPEVEVVYEHRTGNDTSIEFEGFDDSIVPVVFQAGR